MLRVDAFVNRLHLREKAASLFIFPHCLSYAIDYI